MWGRGHKIAMLTARLWPGRGQALVLLVALALAAAQGVRAATPAGATISNVATLTYKVAGGDYGAASNRVSAAVDEVIDFSVTPLGDLTVSPGANHQGVAFRLVSRGNGPRSFALALDPGQAGDSFDPTNCLILVDRANQVAPDLATLAPLGRNALVTLAPAESVTVWAVCDIPDSAGGSGRILLNVRPVMLPGDTAVSAWSPDAATAMDTYHVAGGLIVGLIKSQSVADRLGRPRAIKGAVVTYSLAANLQGQGVARDLTITDPIPAGSTYVPGSLRLDGAALSDADDADAGRAGADGVLVRLGDAPAPALHTVTFQVLINP